MNQRPTPPAATGTIDAAEESIGHITLPDEGENKFEISIVGTAMSGTIHLQRKKPGEADSAYRDVDAFTASAEKKGEMKGRWDLRFYCKTGNWTSGSAECWIWV